MKQNRLQDYFEACQSVLNEKQIMLDFAKDSGFHPEPEPNLKGGIIPTFSKQFNEKMPADVIQRIRQLWDELQPTL